MLRRVYDWCLRKADSPHAERILFWVAFAESSCFIVPPDVMIIVMTLSARGKWLRYGTIALIGSVLGGLAGYLIGMGVWEVVHPFFFQRVFSQETFEKVRGLYATYDYWIVFAAAFTPIPYKVFTIAAGVAAIDIPHFVIASIVGRGGRFYLVSFLLFLFGPPVKVLIEKYFNLLTILFLLLLIGGFVAIKYLVH